MPLFPELSARSLEELLRLFDSGLEPADAVEDEERPLWLDEVATQVAAQGEAGLNALLQRLPAADEPHARALLLGLSFVPEGVRQKNRTRLEGVLLSFLADSRPAVVAQAVDALSDLGFAQAGERVLALLNHPAPEVVGSALRFLARQRPEQARPVLLRSLESSQALVRENAVDELDDLGAVEALPMLRRLLNDEDEDVRQAARTAVRNLEELLPDKEGR
jgi:HEAT repeat protein